MPMTDADRAKQAAKEKAAEEREARELAEKANQPKEATGLAAFFAPSSSAAAPAPTGLPNPIQLPSLPGQAPAGGLNTQQQPSSSMSLLDRLGPPASSTQQTQQQPQQPQFGLFGNQAATAQTQPSLGFGLTGSVANTQQQQQQQQQPALGAFGLPIAQQQPQQQQQPALGAFGLPVAQQQPQQSPFGLFGQQQQSQNAPAPQSQNSNPSGLFSAPSSTAGPAQSTNTNPFGQFGRPSLSQSAPQGFGPAASTQAPGLGLGLANVPKRTPPPPDPNFKLNAKPLQDAEVARSSLFQDIPQEGQKIIWEIDTYIKKEMEIASELKTRTTGADAMETAQEIKKVQDSLYTVSDSLAATQVWARDVIKQVDGDIQDATVMIKIIDKFNEQGSEANHPQWQAAFPYEFFKRTTEELRERLYLCKSTMQQVESHLRNTYQHQQRSAREIANSVETQHEAMVALAARVGTVNAQVAQLKADYTALWRAKTGSTRDPFDIPGRPIVTV